MLTHHVKVTLSLTIFEQTMHYYKQQNHACSAHCSCVSPLIMLIHSLQASMRAQAQALSFGQLGRAHRLSGLEIVVHTISNYPDARTMPTTAGNASVGGAYARGGVGVGGKP